MKINKLLLILLVANVSFAQQIATARIEKVSQNGLHQILIPAELRSFSNEDLSDFRIFDSKGIEVPYSIIKINFEMKQLGYIPLMIISKKQIPNKNTTIVFENSGVILEPIILKITNSDIKKSYSILGSFDFKKWFGLTENQIMANYHNSAILTIPHTSYEYIKIEFNDKNSLPINVEEVGTSEVIHQEYPTENITPKHLSILENKNQKKTKIMVSFDKKQVINRIVFDSLKINPLERFGKIYAIKNIEVKHHIIADKVLVHDFEEGVSQTNEVGFFEKEIIIEIDNQDNPPLKFSKINFIQYNATVIAELNQNEQYTISAGNPKYIMPNYTMQHFSDKYRLPNDFPKAKITNITFTNPSIATVQPNSFYEKPWFMWLCIVLGGVSILYFTTNLVKDMKNNV